MLSDTRQPDYRAGSRLLNRALDKAVASDGLTFTEALDIHTEALPGVLRAAVELRREVQRRDPVTVLACCTSRIGPPCQHRRDPDGTVEPIGCAHCGEPISPTGMSVTGWWHSSSLSVVCHPLRGGRSYAEPSRGVRPDGICRDCGSAPGETGCRGCVDAPAPDRAFAV